METEGQGESCEGCACFDPNSASRYFFFFDKNICHCYLVFSVCAELFIFPQQVKSKPSDEIVNVRLIFKAALPQTKQNFTTCRFLSFKINL